MKRLSLTHGLFLAVALAGCDDHDANIANLVALGFVFGALATSLFVVLALQSWLRLLRHANAEDAVDLSPRTLAHEFELPELLPDTRRGKTP
jgi:hypothetical protein